MKDSRGHAALELALTFPLLALLALGTLQLVLIQQGRLAMEYAAFCAVRVGAVWNGSRVRMRSAALFATLPLFGRTDSPSATATTAERQRLLDQQFRRFGGVVRVAVLNPKPSADLEQSPELDLDRVGTFEEGETGPDPDRDEALRKATLLRVRVRALYELQIPFANAALFWVWQTLHSFSLEPEPLVALARGEAAERRRYFLPLEADYAMRMQSNLYRKWVAP